MSVKSVLRRIRQLVTRHNGRRQSQAQGERADEVAVREQVQGKGMEQRIEAGPFRSI